MKQIFFHGNKEIEQYCSVEEDEKTNKYILERDFLGIVPLFYKEKENKIEFSLKKKQGYSELKPNTRATIIPKKSKRFERIHPTLKLKENKESKERIISKTKSLLKNAIDKRLKLIFKENPNAKIGILFSGGVDSTYLAYELKKRNIDFICYNSSVIFDKKEIKESEDYVWSKEIEKSLGFKVKYIRITEKEIEKTIPKIVNIIDTTNHIKISIALPFYFAIKQAKKDKITHIITGLGSEEIFAGYERHIQSRDINQECVNGLEILYDRDLYRDFSLLKHFEIEAVLPLLDFDLINYSINIPPDMKFKDNSKKWIIRKMAQDEGVPEKFAFRKKRAAQYGSNFDKAIQKISAKKRFKYKQEYINSLARGSK